MPMVCCVSDKLVAKGEHSWASAPLRLLGHVNNPRDHQGTVHVLPLPRPLAPSELFLAEMVTHLLGNAETQEVFTWFGTFFPLW